MADRGAKYADKALSKIDKALQSTYRTASRELSKKLADFNKAFAVKDREKRKKRDNGEITEEEYKDWLGGQVFMRKQWESKIKQVNEVMLHHNEQAVRIINESSFDVFAENYYAEAFKAQWICQNISFNVYNSQAIARLIKDNPQLLPKWKIDEEKDYTWNYKKVKNIVQQGIIQGESVEQIAQRLCRDLSSMNENKMRMFARTAVTCGQNAGRQLQMEEAAKLDIEQEKRWTATLDGHTRDSHRAMDGETVPWNKPFSNKLMFPGDPNGAPEEVYNCRCTTETIYPQYEDRQKDWREDETIDGVPYEVWKQGKKAEKDWKKQQEQPEVDSSKIIAEIASKMQQKAFNGEASEKYKEAILKSLENADPRMLEIVNKTMDKVNINWLEENPNHPVSHYSEGTGNITLLTKDACGEDRTAEDMLYTFWHEYGHFVDDAGVSGSGYGYKSEYSDYFFHSIQSEIMKDDKWMYAAVDDTNALLKSAGLSDRYICEFNDGWYSAGITKEGRYVDPRQMDFDTMDELETSLLNWSKKFSGEIPLDEYRRQFGYPEMPDRKEYIESYYTPKRNIFRERERYKGAHDEYNGLIRDYYEKVSAFESTHDMAKIYDDWSKINDAAKKRKEKVASVTDTFDGGVGGAFSAFIILGGHEPRYYSTNRLGAKEAVANVFSALMTRDETIIEAMNSLCPNTYSLIKGVILK